MSNFNQYENYNLNDFVENESFQNWALGLADKENDDFWSQYLQKYPQKANVVEKAKATLQAIPFIEISEEDAPSVEKIQESFRQITHILGLKRSKQVKKTRLISTSSFWWAAAATIVLSFSIGYSLLYQRQTAETATLETPVLQNDLLPGGNKAMLTLGNGTTIILDNADNGTLSTEGGASVYKLKDGQIKYEEGAAQTGKITFNTITTPPGGQYSLTLSDGTKVWLNAASSLRYPTTFTESDRYVELNGEGYFEVAANESKPFRVFANHTIVEVLGTHFNMNAYADEQLLKTTLLEGSVSVTSGARKVVIEPGQQAQIDAVANTLRVKQGANIEEAVAWKNGLFQFENTSIDEVLRQIGRWYNIDVIFAGDIPAKRFTGKIYRNVNASEVFSILEGLDIHFKIEGRKVIVTK